MVTILLIFNLLASSLAQDDGAEAAFRGFLEGLDADRSMDLGWLREHFTEDASLMTSFLEHLPREFLRPLMERYRGLLGGEEEPQNDIDEVSEILCIHYDIVPDLKFQVKNMDCAFAHMCVSTWIASGTVLGTHLEWEGSISIGFHHHKISSLRSSLILT